jgi:hypothetical protein
MFWDVSVNVIDQLAGLGAGCRDQTRRVILSTHQESIHAVLKRYGFNKRVLGIAVGERSLLIAEGDAARSNRGVLKQGEFVYPPGVSLETGEELGQALGEFLKSNGFTARRVVFGVPARWLILRTHTLPPVDEANAQAILNLQAQAGSTPELGEMVFDFAGEYSHLRPSNVTLIGLAAVWRDRLLRLAKSLSLNVIAITPGVLAGFIAESHGGRNLVLAIGSECAELAAFEKNRITFLRHLCGRASISALAGDLRRTIAMLMVGEQAPAELILRNEAELGESDVQAIRDAAGIRVVERAGGAMNSVASALAMMDDRGPEVDFLHPKLLPPRVPIASRRTIWALAAGLVIAVIAIFVFADLFSIQRGISRSEQRLAAMETELKTARPFVASMQSVEAFQRGNPVSLACLGDVTAMLPEGGQTYLTAFHLQGDVKGDLTGRAVSDKDVLNLMDQFAASGRFIDLKCKIEGRGSGSEITFSVTFTYVPRH